MPRISVDPTEVKKHPKFHAFRKKLDWQPHHAFGFLCAFWGEVANTEANESGDISDWTPDYLADRIVTNNVDPDRLWEALVPGYIEARPNERFFLRDWLEIIGPALRQKYHNTDRQKLTDIWAGYGRIYGRESKQSKPEEGGKSVESRSTSFSIEKEIDDPAPPDIIKEPPKDGEEEGEGNASFSPSCETEGKKEAAMLPASRRFRTPIELETAPEVERRDDKTGSEVHSLLDRFHDRLTEEYGEAAAFSYGPWGKYLKMLLKDGHPYQEIDRRFEFWLSSTDAFVRQNRNSAGAFYNRFNELKTGPISNHGSRNGAARAPFDDGAATVRAGPESTF